MTILNSSAVITGHCGRMLCAGLFLAIAPMASTASLANDNCQRLEALHRQYAGVTLTGEQKKLKRKLVAWYYKNCRPVRRADAQR
jgi:hypothetical protein